MADDELKELDSQTVQQEPIAGVPALRMVELDAESKDLLNKLIVETDIEKTKDLTHLFNVNQNKKTMVRVDKLSQLMDTLTDQAIKRYQERPDEISNQELFLGLKTIQDIIEKSRRQVMGADEKPLIQINQQNNDFSGTQPQTKESRERVMAAVNNILQGILPQQGQATAPIYTIPVVKEEEDKNDK